VVLIEQLCAGARARHDCSSPRVEGMADAKALAMSGISCINPIAPRAEKPQRDRRRYPPGLRNGLSEASTR